MADTEASLVKPWKDFDFLPPGFSDSSSTTRQIANGTASSYHVQTNQSADYDDGFVFNFSLTEAFEIIRKSQRTKILFPEAEVTLIAVYSVLMTTGIVSNLLVCFVVTRQCLRKRMTLGSSAPKSRNLYVANLALADLVLCCICMPFTLITLIQYEWGFGSLLCKLVPVIQGTNIMVSAGTITAIAFDRYITIVRPPGSPAMYNHSRCKVLLIILFIWIVSFALTSPVFFYTVIEPVTFYNILLYEKCIERWPSNFVYTTFTIGFAFVQFVIPGLFLVTIHVRISAYLKVHLKPKQLQPRIEVHSPMDEEEKGSGGGNGKNGKDDSSRKEFLSIRKESVASDDRKSSDLSRKLSDSSRKSSTCYPGKPSDLSGSPRRDVLATCPDFSFHNLSMRKSHRKRRELRRNRRTMFLLSCIAVAYAVSWLPMTVYQVLITQLPGSYQNPKVVYVAFAVCHVFAMSTTITNPLLYGWLNPNFRREFYALFSAVSAFFAKVKSAWSPRSAATTAQTFSGNRRLGHAMTYLSESMKVKSIPIMGATPRMQV